jgi:8-oxo-dGTP diphosphatase
MSSQRTRVGAYALMHEAGRLLLCRIAPHIPRLAGTWSLPGGGVEFGEAPADAVVREVEEETGLKIRVKAVATVDSHVDRAWDEGFHAIRVIYHVEVIGGTLRDETSGTTDRCAWVPLHPPADIPLAQLGQVGMELARQAWPVGPAAGD